MPDELMENGPAVSMATIGRPWRGRALRTMFPGDIILLMITDCLFPSVIKYFIIYALYVNSQQDSRSLLGSATATHSKSD